MTAKELKEKYLKFFEKRGHKLLPNVSLVPEDDPTTLFISAGMQPLVPHLLGQPHPLGKRLVSLQRCLRTGDIEEVGNVFHNTFFEMLGNWSLGDYWKKESLSWSLEFLTKVLDLDPKRLHVTVFEGDKTAPKDEESEKAWLSLGIPRKRIYFLPKEDNWWEAGATGPGGPDSEIFYDLGKPACSPGCRPGDNCGRFFEMWNNVFMEYNRKPDGTYEKLKQKNVDTGMGVERTSVVLQKVDNIFQTDVFVPIISKIEEIFEKSYQEERNQRPIRIIADHLRAATFALADGVVPSNKDRGYIVRRLIRRAVRFGRTLFVKGESLPAGRQGAPGGQLIKPFTAEIAKVVIDNYKDEYPLLFVKGESLPAGRQGAPSGQSIKLELFNQLNNEEERFLQTLDKGLKEIEKIVKERRGKMVNGEKAFYLYESFGFPLELTREILAEKGIGIEEKGFQQALEKHQELSRKGARQKFAGGLADQSETIIKYHTATHLLQAALRKVLGDHVRQAGSNITNQRARFDFTHTKPLTDQQIRKIEELVNQKIKEDLRVCGETIPFEKVRKQGALVVPGKTYPEKVFVYKINNFSYEVCGGPHVTKTGEIGRIKIIKEQGVGEGRRRIYLKIKNKKPKTQT